jgi:hypothetical protein
MRMRNALVVIVGLIGSLCVGSALHSTRAEGRKIVVTASKITWGAGVDIEKAECLSLNRKIGNHIFKKDYSDDSQILIILRQYFPNKNLSPSDPDCPYVLSFNIIESDTRAVTYLGQFSRTLLTFVVSEKDASGALDKKAAYKNLYLFRNDLAPMEAFEVGLKAFPMPQQERWQTFEISIDKSI